LADLNTGTYPDFDSLDQHSPLVRRYFSETLTATKEAYKLVGISIDERSCVFGVGIVLAGIALWMLPSLGVLIDANKQGINISSLWVVVAPFEHKPMGYLLESLLIVLSAILCARRSS
jgi:type III secretory pathway component EscT